MKYMLLGILCILSISCSNTVNSIQGFSYSDGTVHYFNLRLCSNFWINNKEYILCPHIGIDEITAHTDENKANALVNSPSLPNRGSF